MYMGGTQIEGVAFSVTSKGRTDEAMDLVGGSQKGGFQKRVVLAGAPLY